MKNTKNSFGAILLFIALIAGACAASAPDPARIARMRNIIESRNYTFKPDAIMPVTGRRMELTSGLFYMRLADGSLTAYLPYFGNTFIPPTSTDQLGINFSTTNFSYSVITSKKGRLTATIRPEGTPVVSEMILSVFENGSADLRVNGDTRQTIVYKGVVLGN